MSPVAHLQYGWWFAHWGNFERHERAAIALAGAAADLDGLSILGGSDAFYRYHHLLFHNLGATLGLATISGMIFWRKPLVWLLVVFSFGMHTVEDYFTSSWDQLPWVPFSHSSINLAHHLPAWVVQGVFQGVATVFILGMTVWIYLRHRRTPLEIFSPSFDRMVLNFVLLPWRNHCSWCSLRARFRCESCDRAVCSTHAAFSSNLHVHCGECAQNQT